MLPAIRPDSVLSRYDQLKEAYGILRRQFQAICEENTRLKRQNMQLLAQLEQGPR